jgi:hypothetical protein
MTFPIRWSAGVLILLFAPFTRALRFFARRTQVRHESHLPENVIQPRSLL